VNRETNRHTDMLIAILCQPTWCEDLYNGNKMADVIYHFTAIKMTVSTSVQNTMSGRPGSVADIIAPKVRQPVKFSKEGYRRRVKPYIRPLQPHPQTHKLVLVLYARLKTATRIHQNDSKNWTV